MRGLLVGKPIKKSATADYFSNSSLMAATIPARALRINITVMTIARILLSFPIEISFLRIAVRPAFELISLYLLLFESKPSSHRQILFTVQQRSWQSAFLPLSDRFFPKLSRRENFLFPDCLFVQIL